jgi:hypothetical protein
MGLLTIVLAGCSEEDFPVASDVDELTRYILQEPTAKELFRADGLIRTTTYTLPSVPGAQFSDSLLSSSREITVLADSIAADYGSLGMLLEAMVQVEDLFTIQVTKQEGTATTVDTVERALTRFGFFLKLQDDAAPFLGWSLWGYNSLGVFQAPVTVSVTGGGTTFSGDLSLYTQRPKRVLSNMSYLLLSDIVRIGKGSDLSLETHSINPDRQVQQVVRLSADGNSGAVYRTMIQVDSTMYVDTLTTPNPNSRLYNLLFLQSFSDQDIIYSRGWCIPYRAD